MRCQQCHGLGRVVVDHRAATAASFQFGVALRVLAEGMGLEALCPECYGSGVAHCCNGLFAQPIYSETDAV
jgi:hypothetical protein